jgi:glycerophosphoryl diester phosphodiesterase
MKTLLPLALVLSVASAIGAEPLLRDDFVRPGLSAWKIVDVGTNAAPSRWRVSHGAVHQTSNIYTRVWNGDRRADWTGSYLMHRTCSFRDGVVELAFWSTDDDGVGLAWHMRDKDNLCKVQLASSTSLWQVSRTVNGKFRCIEIGNTGYTKDKLQLLRVQCLGPKTAIWLDDELLFVGEVDGPADGSVAIESRGNDGTHADYVQVRKAAGPWPDYDGLLNERSLQQARLEHLAVLPGEPLRLCLPAAVDGAATVVADGRELARSPLAGKTVELWRNPGGLDTLGEVRLWRGKRLVRSLPFHIWTAWPKGIGVCAHRGDNRVAPENTVPAIKLAVEKGAHQIEIDVTRTKDGHLVLLHDLTLDRTTDGTGKPGDYTLADLKKLDAGSWKSEKWQGTRMPTLEEALAVIPNGIWVNLHLKAGVEEPTTRLITRLKRTRWCFLACSRQQAAKARAINPDVLICNMSGQRGPDSPYPAETIAMQANFLQLHGFAESMPHVADKLAAHGVQRNYFPANDPAFFRRLLEAGVQFPLTDNLDAMLAVLKDIDVPPPATEPVR